MNTNANVAKKNELQIFHNNQFGEIRAIKDSDGNPIFAGVDVASVLGYKNPREAVRVHVDEDDRSHMQLSDFQEGSESLLPHQKGSKLLVINESGVYSLIMRSNLPNAKQFKKWVTSEVLPSIRKNGGYLASVPDETPEQIMARALVLAQHTIEENKKRTTQLEQKNHLLSAQSEAQAELIEEQAPRVLFAQAVETSAKSILIGELARLITQNGVIIGQNRLFSWMRDNGYLLKKTEAYNQPTQRAMEQGLFEIKKTSISKPDGTVLVTSTTKVTGKGQIYFVNKFLYNSQQGTKGGAE